MCTFSLGCSSSRCVTTGVPSLLFLFSFCPVLSFLGRLHVPIDWIDAPFSLLVFLLCLPLLRIRGVSVYLEFQFIHFMWYFYSFRCVYYMYVRFHNPFSISEGSRQLVCNSLQIYYILNFKFIFFSARIHSKDPSAFPCYFSAFVHSEVLSSP